MHPDTFFLALIPSYKGLGLAMAYLLAYLLHTVWVVLYVEVNLVPKSFTKKRFLIVFSLIILSLSVWQAVNEMYSYALSFFLVCISCTPLLLFLKIKHKMLKPGVVND